MSTSKQYFPDFSPDTPFYESENLKQTGYHKQNFLQFGCFQKKT